MSLQKRTKEMAKVQNEAVKAARKAIYKVVEKNRLPFDINALFVLNLAYTELHAENRATLEHLISQAANGAAHLNDGIKIVDDAEAAVRLTVTEIARTRAEKLFS